MRHITTTLCIGMACHTMAQNTDGDALFSSAAVHEVQLTFSSSTFYQDLLTAYQNDVYTLCGMTIDGVAYDSVGVKMKGNSSFNNPSQKKSLKIDMNEYVSGQTHDGLKKFNLNNGFKDPTMMREKLCLDFLIAHDIPAPRCTYANVYMNGQLWGFYTLVEEVNKDFLSRWAADNDGNLYKGDPNGDLRWSGDQASNYMTKYEKETNETENDWSDLIALISDINNTTDNDFGTTMNAVWDLPSVFGSWVGYNLFSNLDSYLGSGHNYYIYHDSTDLRWHWINWDVNEAFGTFTMGMSATQMKGLSIFHISSPTTNRPLYDRMLADAWMRQSYIDRYCQMVDAFSNEVLDAKIDSLRAVLDPHIQADPNKMYTYEQFIQNIDSDIISGGPAGGTVIGLKPFISERRASVLAELAQEDCANSVAEASPAEALRVWPLPASGSMTVAYGRPFSQLTVTDLEGRTVVRQWSAPALTATADVSRLAPGIYFLSLDGAVTLAISVVR
jgi:spore coat protein CotH